MKWKKNMEPVSFDSLDWLYLEDYEGNIQLASEPYYKPVKLADGVWQVLTDGDYTYVLEGDDEAVCIDTGNGAGNIRKYAEELTGKPVYRAINTHCHFDHTCNNYLFDVVYMHPNSYPGRCRPNELFKGMEFPDDYPVVFINEGDVFNLAGRPLEVFNEENHAIGSLQFLDKKSRILFIGDEVHGNFLDCSAPVEHCYKVLSKFESLRPYYDRIAAGCGVWDAIYIDKYLEILKYILDGHADEGEEDFPPFADVTSSVSELNGKVVNHRRCPHVWSIGRMFAKNPVGKELIERWGAPAIGMGRRLGPNGPFDRRMVKEGYIVNYYRNKIWGKLDTEMRR